MSVKCDRVRCVVRRDVQGPLNLYRRHGSFSSPGMAESEGRYALVCFRLGLLTSWIGQSFPVRCPIVG